MKIENFVFYDFYTHTNDDENIKHVEIPSSIENKSDLFLAYDNQIGFPDFFGWNWDALYDCLTDLNWTKEHEIRIVHTNLPLHQNKTEKTIYLTLLVDVVKSWKNSPLHKINVLFPKKFQHVIELTKQINE